MIKEYNLLNVKLQALSPQSSKELLRSYLQSDSQHHLVTVNPEFIVAAQRNPEFKNILNESSLSTIDGTGIVQALKFFGHKVSLEDRLTGAQLLTKILEIAEYDHYKVMFLIYSKGLSKKDELASRLEQIYPQLEYKISDEINCLTDVQSFPADILIVGLGAPRQEFWINEYINQIPSVKIAIGVGGAIDFLSGAIKRAPKIFRSFGLEWFWRLLKQPHRLPRIFRAIFVFYFFLLKYKLSKIYAKKRNN
jgi:N-acetylglucosaminyldiphosphoundecaprenol N-acetyl-beta-D-mannosaminyltransferase